MGVLLCLPAIRCKINKTYVQATYFHPSEPTAQLSAADWIALSRPCHCFMCFHPVQPDQYFQPQCARSNSMPTLPPTFTPPPKPTKEHIGRLIFTCTRGDFNQLCMINADGTGFQQLTELEAHSYYPVYSPLGGSVVYASNQNGGVFDLFLFMFDGARLFRLTEQIGNVISPSFSPDGSRILFANRAAEGPTSLWTIDTTGENADLLYAGPNTIVGADWAPVGNRIAFAMAVDQPDAYEIFIMNDDGTNAQQLTRGLPGIGGSLDWSPDGKSLLIYCRTAGG